MAVNVTSETEVNSTSSTTLTQSITTNTESAVVPYQSTGYVGPLGAERQDGDGNMHCQFPLCDRVAFIHDPEHNLFVCDLHSEITPNQLKIAKTDNISTKNYKAPRTLKYFFKKTSTQDEIVTKTNEISKNLELPCNKKRSSWAIKRKPENVTDISDADTPKAKEPRYMGSFQAQDKAIDSLMQKYSDDPATKVFEHSDLGILCTVCGNNPIPCNQLHKHYDTEKHKTNIAKYLKDKQKQPRVDLLLLQSKVEPQISLKNKNLRYDWTKAMMQAAVPMRKIDNFRAIIEKYSGCSLTDRSHLLQNYVPLIHDEEKKEVKEFVNKTMYAIIFDGTTRWGENFVIIVRCVKNRRPQQKLLKLGRYKRSFKELGGYKNFRLL